MLAIVAAVLRAPLAPRATPLVRAVPLPRQALRPTFAPLARALLTPRVAARRAIRVPGPILGHTVAFAATLAVVRAWA